MSKYTCTKYIYVPYNDCILKNVRAFVESSLVSILLA